jgi:phosphoribosyl 1,2-cyclic phosphodiesterase
MKIKFWGVRGSIPCPGHETSRFGGNTSCLQVVGGEETVILDAGTGIRELGQQLTATKKPLRIHLLLTHTHWDHIQGFPFFTPIYFPGNEILIYGPRALEKSLEEALMFQMQYSYFPVRGVELAARVKFTELGEETFTIGDVEVSTKSMNHPIRVLAYKFSHKGRTAIYTGDNEPYYDVLAERGHGDTGIHRRSEFIKECNQRVVEFCKAADLLVADSQYTDEEYETKRGWGHSSISQVLDLAHESAVKRLVLFHHEPTHDDRRLAAIEQDARTRARKSKGKLQVLMAREGQTIDV